jgi:hypothetical protein
MRCDVCGHDGSDVRPALMAWKPPYQIHHGQFDTGPRCQNHDDCRARVESQGDEWPLVEVERKSA